MTCTKDIKVGDIVHVRAKVMKVRGVEQPYDIAVVHCDGSHGNVGEVWVSDKTILKVEQRPLVIGDTVVSDNWDSGWTGKIIAIDGDEAWLRTTRGQATGNSVYKLETLRRTS